MMKYLEDKHSDAATTSQMVHPKNKQIQTYTIHHMQWMRKRETQMKHSGFHYASSYLSSRRLNLSILKINWQESETQYDYVYVGRHFQGCVEFVRNHRSGEFQWPSSFLFDAFGIQS